MAERTDPRTSARRDFMKSSMAVGGAVAAAGVFGSSTAWAADKKIKHLPLDPMNPDILFGTTSSIWGGGGVAPDKAHDLAYWIPRVAAYGLQGIEPYGTEIEVWRSNPKGLRKLFDEAGITFVDASN